MSHGLYIRDTSISSNRLRNGFPNNNSYYKTILTLHISQLSLNHGYLEISGNRIRNILHSIAGSYTLLSEHTLLNITKNIAHTTLKQDKVSTQSLGTVYPFQFLSEHNLNAKVGGNETLHYEILVTEYVFTLPGYPFELLLNNCTLLTNTPFKLSKSK